MMKTIILVFMFVLLGQFSFAKKEASDKKTGKAKVTASKKADKKNLAKKDSKKNSSKKELAKKETAGKKSKKTDVTANKKDSKKKLAKKTGKADKVAAKSSKGKLEAMKYMAENGKKKSRNIASQKPLKKEKPKKETVKPKEVVKTPAKKETSVAVPAQEQAFTAKDSAASESKREVAKEADEFEVFNLETDPNSGVERPDILTEE